MSRANPEPGLRAQRGKYVRLAWISSPCRDGVKDLELPTVPTNRTCIAMQADLTVSIVQMTSSNRHEPNVEAVRVAAAAAKSDGAQLLALPEVAGLMNANGDDARTQIVAAGDDPFISECREQATRHGLWIHPGSTPVLGPRGRFLNHTALIDDRGGILATYDKIHLFDVHLEGKQPMGESRRYDPGDRAVLVDTPWGPWGLSICYDLRFPQLYRDYARNGATVLFVPSAFTVPTGSAHWRILLRGRAIENGAWVIAAAQVGQHDDGRTTYGHSMVVGPWGDVVTDLGGDRPCQKTLRIDLDAVRRARSQIPSLAHDRRYGFLHVRATGPGNAVRKLV